MTPLKLSAICLSLSFGFCVEAGEPKEPANVFEGIESATQDSPGSVDLCAGLIQDKQAHPQSSMPKPAYMQPYTDPVFGTRVIRITNVSAPDIEDAVIKPMYSTIQAWNADESYLMLWNRGRGHQLYDGRTYAYIKDLPLESPTDIEQVFWDPLDPDVLYYPSSYNAMPRFMRYRVSTNSNDVVRDFRGAPTNCAEDWSTLLNTGGDPQDMSWGPEKIIGLSCGTTLFLYSIATDQVLGVKTKEEVYNTPVVTFDGTLAFLEGDVLDQQLNLVRSLGLANVGEHSSLGRGAQGALYGAVDFDGSVPGTLIVYDMNTGAKTPLISQANGWPYPPTSTHVSGLVRSGPLGWFAVSVVGSSYECVLCQELLLANADTGTVCRVAHHHSSTERWGYWAEPHVVISPSGTRLLFGSDWEDGDSVDTYVVELTAYSNTQAPKSPTGLRIVGDEAHLASAQRQ